MRKIILSTLAAIPFAILGSSEQAKASPWSYYGYSSPYSSFSMVNGPGGYSGMGYGGQNWGMYSDNYGTTTCMSMGSSVMCF